MTTAEMTETEQILNDPETMKALFDAENSVVLAQFALDLLELATEHELWAGADEPEAANILLFDRVWELQEEALRLRGSIRARYGALA